MISPRRRLLARLRTLFEGGGLELTPEECRDLVKKHCGTAQLEDARDQGLEILERVLYERIAAVMQLKQQKRDELQAERRPLAKIRPREDPPAEKTGTA